MAQATITPTLRGVTHPQEHQHHSQRDQAQPTIPQGINTYRQRGERQLNRGNRNNIAGTLPLIFHQRLTGGLPKSIAKALGIVPFIR